MLVRETSDGAFQRRVQLPFTHHLIGLVPGNEIAHLRQFIVPGREIGLREQLGRLAQRNSCRTAWSYAFDVRAALRPRIGTRRVSVGIEAYNLGAGLDLMLHGREGLRGWGHDGRGVDPVLLHPDGFDPGTGAYRYQVNEAFGQAIFSRLTEGAPFTVQISGRVALGPRPRTDPLGGFADLGTPGIASGALTCISVTGAAGGRAGRDQRVRTR